MGVKMLTATDPKNHHPVFSSVVLYAQGFSEKSSCYYIGESLVIVWQYSMDPNPAHLLQCSGGRGGSLWRDELDLSSDTVSVWTIAREAAA